MPFYIFSFFLLVKEAVKRRPDFLYERYCSTFLTSFFARIFRVRHILEIDGPLGREEQNLLSLLEKKKLEKTACIISSSPKCRGLLESKYPGLGKKVRYVPDGVNHRLLFPRPKEECRRELGLSSELFLVGYTGLIYWAYDFQLVFQAMQELERRCPKLRLLILGPNASSDTPRNVFFVKGVSHNKVPKYINALDLCLWPRSREGLREWGMRSTKLHEYIACGKRVLVPNMEGEKPDPLLEPFLIYYHSGDKEDFKKKVVECYKNPVLCEKVGEENRRAFVEKYSWEACGRKLERVLQKIVGGS